MKLVTNLFYLIKRFSYLLVFITSIILMFTFWKINTKITYSPTYIFINCVLFIAVIILFLIFIVKYIITQIKTKSVNQYKKNDIFVLGLVIIFSIFFVFIILKGGFWGRFSILSSMMGNIFVEEVFQSTLLSFSKTTYSMVIYSILQTIFHIKVTPVTLLMVNKIFSVLILVIVFLISKFIFKKNWISLIVFFSFISSIFVRTVFVSIEYGTGALFFTYASILFLFNFIRNKDLNSFIISNICFILASYYRVELALLFGIPYIAYYCIFLYNNKPTRKYIAMTVIILMIAVMALIRKITLHDISFGGFVDEKGLLSLIGKTGNILKYNIFVQKDLYLQSGRVSLFTYTGLIISLILIVILIYYLIKGKNIRTEYKPLFLLAFYNLSYFFFQISFHMEGFREGWKYQVNYFLCEIILTYFVILWVIDKIMSNKSKAFVNIIKFSSISLFFIIALVTTTALSHKTDQYFASNPAEVIEMSVLRKNVKLDESCKIIKVHPNQPQLDNFFGLQRNALYFDELPRFYDSLKEYEKQGKCFYYYDARHFTEFDYKYQNIARIDFKKVDQLFSTCVRSVVFDFNYQKPGDHYYRSFSLIKYTC